MAAAAAVAVQGPLVLLAWVGHFGSRVVAIGLIHPQEQARMDQEQVQNER